MYTGYEIDHDSRTKLRELFPPKYRNFLGHHITEQFGVPHDVEPPQTPKKVEVIGYINNGENVEGFLVRIDGQVKRPSGGMYHITWSIDRSDGAKPFHTNMYTDTATPLKRPIEIDVTPKVFDKATDSYVKE